MVKNEEKTDAEQEERKADIQGINHLIIFLNAAYKCVLKRGPSFGRGKWSFE